MPKKTNTQSKNWCFTDFELLDFRKIFEANQDVIRYICWGKEICPNSKKVHMQGWVQFKNKKRLNGVKKILGSPKIHLEVCQGSEGSNNKYCAKDGQFIKLGKYLVQGQRTDLEKIQKDIKDGASLGDIMENNFETYCRYRGGIKDYHEFVSKSNRKAFRKVEVVVHSGPTNTGKTRKAMENPDVFKIEGSGLDWFDGYTGESTLVIDEYDNDVKITKMLNILDGYRLRLAIKGGFTYAAWTKVIITTNLTKDLIHSNAKQAHRDALFRRINTWCDFS